MEVGVVVLDLKEMTRVRMVAGASRFVKNHIGKAAVRRRSQRGGGGGGACARSEGESSAWGWCSGASRPIEVHIEQQWRAAAVHHWSRRGGEGGGDLKEKARVSSMGSLGVWDSGG